MLFRLLAYNYTAGAEAVPAISCLISTGGGYSQKPTFGAAAPAPRTCKAQPGAFFPIMYKARVPSSTLSLSLSLLAILSPTRDASK